MNIIVTKSAEETKKVAKLFAKDIIGEFQVGKKATIIALVGNLGAGKTTFTQGFAEGLGIKEKIQSPTFVILKEYEIHQHKISKSCFKHFYHIDCYRLKNEKDAKTIDLEEIIKNPENLVLIEWAERVKKILPKKQLLTVKFFHINEETRKIVFN